MLEPFAVVMEVPSDIVCVPNSLLLAMPKLAAVTSVPVDGVGGVGGGVVPGMSCVPPFTEISLLFLSISLMVTWVVLLV